MKTKKDKQYEQKKLIAQTIVDFKTSRIAIEDLSKELFQRARSAAEMNQDEYANELLENSVYLDELAYDFRYMELWIETEAVTANAIGNLSNLPNALKAVKKIFNNVPNITKLGNDMAGLFNSIKSVREQIKDLRMGISKSRSQEIYQKLFGENKSVDQAHGQRLADKKRALEASLALGTDLNTTPAAVDNPATKNAGIDNPASIDAIASMLDEEKKRK